MVRLLLKIVFLSACLVFQLSRVFAFPIFAPPIAKINCDTSSGFLGDSSNVAFGFAGGTATNVAWDGTKMLLAAGQTTGTFTSRVIDNSCIGIGKPWLNLSWTTTLPFGKPLPSSSESTTNYSGLTNSTLLSSLIGLWHFDQNSYNGTANEVVDSSGNSNHGYIYFGSASTNGTGLFNKAMTGNGSAYVKTTNTPANPETATFSVWYKSSDLSVPWAAIGGRKRTDGSGYGWTLRMNDTGGVYLQIDTSGGANQVDCYYATNIMNGTWRHLVGVINNGSASLWVNGTKVDTCTYARGTGFSADAPILLMSDTISATDEAALWNRALADTEVQSLYQRGANRVKIQVRSCADSTCSANPTWRGPDNTASTYFTEMNNNSNQSAMNGTIQSGTPLLLFSNFPSISLASRYLQYKFILETDNTTYRPDVKTIGPGR